MKFLKALFLFCVVLSFSQSQVNCFFQTWVRSWVEGIIEEVTKGVFGKAEEIIDKIKIALQESMDTFFDKKLVPLINKIEEMVHKNLSQFEEIIYKAIEEFKKALIEMMNNAAKKAQEGVSTKEQTLNKEL
jgi:phage-related protein